MSSTSPDGSATHALVWMPTPRSGGGTSTDGRWELWEAARFAAARRGGALRVPILGASAHLGLPRHTDPSLLAAWATRLIGATVEIRPASYTVNYAGTLDTMPWFAVHPLPEPGGPR